MRSRCETSQCPQSFDAQFYQEIASNVEQIEQISAQQLTSKDIDFNSLNQIVEKFARIEQDLNAKIAAEITQFARLEAERQKKAHEQQQQLQAEILAQQKRAEFTQRLKSNQSALTDQQNKLQSFIQTLSNGKYVNIQRFQNDQLNQTAGKLIDSVNQTLRDLQNFINNESNKFSNAKETEFDQIDAKLTETVKKFSGLETNFASELKQIDLLIEKCEQELASREKAAAEAKKAQEEAAERAKQAAEKQRRDEEAKKAAAVTNLNDNDKQGINSLTLAKYETYQKQFSEFRKDAEDALSAANLKMYRFDLQKAINFPLNSMLEDKEGDSSENRRNFVEKIKTLGRLLSGQTCTITSTLSVNPSRHAKSIDYCLVYLARKLSEKSEESVGNRPETAHQYCQVAIEVLKQIRQFEVILIGQLQEKCPYVVPYYKTRRPGQTDEQAME
jgi:hypothetical protein